jgi:tetratricopeptide (TPR) repeat protein
LVPPVFISHATADDDFVAELRQRLEGHGIPVWVDSRSMRGGSKLGPKIEAAISDASHFLVVLSPDTVNSSWVRREISKALEVEGSRQGDGYRVIPVLRPGITPQALDNWFPEQPLAVPVEVGPGGLSAALPDLFAALGRRLPTDHQPFEEPEAGHVEELVLTLVDPRIETAEGKRRAEATATLSYEPGHSGARNIVSRRFRFTAPIGPIEAGDLRWYLESYYVWPVGIFRERADAIEARLPGWGGDLYEAALGDKEAREALAAWQQAADGTERRFSVMVDRDLPADAPEEAQAEAAEAATELLSLPWELLHDGRSWLFQGRNAVRVRRRLPNREHHAERPTALPVRILLVSPRPEKDDKGNPVGYIDHRVSARPLVEAVENLGDLARLTVLQPPTYAALERALRDGDAGQPFDVVHFDGHGVYDRRLGLGGLCFEDAKDEGTWGKRTLDFVDAARLGGLVRQHRIPLVFLEACQSALTDMDPTASVAARLLDEGVTSVVAMSHSVLVETARRFVERFYAGLASGARVGAAMLAGQQALFADSDRGKILGAGQLRLQDWFVPVLYQEEQDPTLITKVPPPVVQRLAAEHRQLSLGELPEPPSHNFHGRSRDLLALERLLHRESWAVVRGTGGQGKTTIAVELARWLVRTGRFARAAFVSLEHYRDAPAVLDTLSRQLVGDKYSVAQYSTLDEALQPIERALADNATIMVIDNCESVLPERTGSDAELDPAEESSKILDLCQRLLRADPRTRIVLTTREPLPAPFGARGRERQLGSLDPADAIELVSEVMKQNGWTPPSYDAGTTPEEVSALVEAVNRHARALVLLAPEVAKRGVTTATEDLQSLMARLERKHPGDRENSLYASVELSLRRLSAESREHVRTLAACQGGAHLNVIGMLTGLEPDAARQLAVELITVGLGEDMGHGHLRLDPGLAPHLLGELTAGEVEVLRTRWAEAMVQLTRGMYNELFEDTQLARRLTLLELPNLLQMLNWLQVRWPPEEIVSLAESVESLVRGLGRRQDLGRATGVRERAARRLGDWSHARYLTEYAHVNRLLDRGDLPAAHVAAQQLLANADAAGRAAYPSAAYDLAMTHFVLGRVLESVGAAEEALVSLAEARGRFRGLVAAGDESAEHMVGVTFTLTGDCLQRLGRLEDAANAYEERVTRALRATDRRGAAVGKSQLATVRLLQRRYEEALQSYREARDTFEEMSEPGAVATLEHQIGIVYEETDQFELAEQAYRQSLAIKVRVNDVAGQANSLGQLGNLYRRLGRNEEAARLYGQAANIDVQSGKMAREGMSRRHLAITLLALHRHEEARRELERAIQCEEPYGNAAESWKTWAVLRDLEDATGNTRAAEAAQRRAMEAYLTYRRVGGESRSNQARLFALVALAISHNEQGQLTEQLNDLLGPEAPSWFLALVRLLQSVVAGDRDPALAANPELDYINAAEVLLLLEELGPATPR